MREQIVEIEYAVAFLGAQIAAREQATEAAPGCTVARIGEEVRCAVGKNETPSGMIGKRQLLFPLDEMCPHHSGKERSKFATLTKFGSMIFDLARFTIA